MSLVIYGNGKIARVIYQFVKEKFDVACFTVDNEFIKEDVFEGLPLIPFEKLENIYPADSHNIIVAVGYVGMNNIRKEKFSQCLKKGYAPVNYIHPSVEIHSNSVIGQGNVILDHVTIQPETSIGDNNFIWSNSVIAHGCKIENDCWIASNGVMKNLLQKLLYHVLSLIDIWENMS